MKRVLSSDVGSPAKKAKGPKNWVPEETEAFYDALKKFGKSWQQIQGYMRELGYESRKSGLYNSKYQTFAFNEWWAGRPLTGALSDLGHTISGAPLDPYGGKCWAKMQNARFEIVQDDGDAVLCKARMVRDSRDLEADPVTFAENEVELKFDARESQWVFTFEGVTYITDGGLFGFPREATWRTDAKSLVLKIRDSGRARGARKSTGKRRASHVRGPKISRAMRSTAELRGRKDIIVEIEETYPRNDNREKDQCILGVSVIHPTEGNLRPNQETLPHLVFREYNLRVNCLLKQSLQSVVNKALFENSSFVVNQYDNMKDASSFLWDFCVYEDRKSYDQYIMENSILKDWLLSICEDLKQSRTQRVCVVPLNLVGDVLSHSNTKASNVQLAFHAQVLAAPNNGKNAERATRAIEQVEALNSKPFATPLTIEALQGQWVNDQAEIVNVNGDIASIKVETKQIIETKEGFQLHTWFLHKNSTSLTWVDLSTKNGTKLRWMKQLTVPILPEERINFRVELHVSKKDESKFGESSKTLLNTFASMVQTELEEIFLAYNKANKNLPVYMSHVRDCFSHPLHPVETKIGDTIKTDWYLDVERSEPRKYSYIDTSEECRKQKYVHSGIVTYDNAFTSEELINLEKDCDMTLQMARDGKFLENTAQSDPHEGTGPKDRTKFFFNLRYNWRVFEKAQPDSNYAAGIRSDVSPIQPWMNMPTKRLVELGIIEDVDWINQISFNDYSSGTLGLGPHFDDIERFARPITTIRLFSDSRLSFGLRYYGINQGSTIIPLPRGRICVLKKNSYASDQAKHAVRDCDITERSAALILRHVHLDVEQKAREYQAKKEAEALKMENEEQMQHDIEVKVKTVPSAHHGFEMKKDG